MKISVITPTCDRQAGIALAEKYMARQTLQPHEWIVADGSATPAVLTAGQVHLHVPAAPGAANLANNMLRALDAVTGDVVVVVEDDDWYAPEHIDTCVHYLQYNKAYGCPRLQYYNVQHRMWRAMKNNGSALCQTAFSADLIPRMRNSIEAALAHNDFGLDRRFWAGIQGLAVGPVTTIGIKGLPGCKGLGIGHRPDGRWFKDPQFKKLREWIGDDVENYENIFNG